MSLERNGIMAAYCFNQPTSEVARTLNVSERELNKAIQDGIAEIRAQFPPIPPTAEEIQAAVAALPELERQVIILTYDENLKRREVAKRLGLKQMQTKRLFESAIQMLGKELWAA